MDRTFLLFWYAFGIVAIFGEAAAFKLGEMRRSAPARHRQIVEVLENPIQLVMHLVADASAGPFAFAYLDGWKLVGAWSVRRLAGRR